MPWLDVSLFCPNASRPDDWFFLGHPHIFVAPDHAWSLPAEAAAALFIGWAFWSFLTVADVPPFLRTASTPCERLRPSLSALLGTYSLCGPSCCWTYHDFFKLFVARRRLFSLAKTVESFMLSSQTLFPGSCFPSRPAPIFAPALLPFSTYVWNRFLVLPCRPCPSPVPLSTPLLPTDGAGCRSAYHPKAPRPPIRTYEHFCVSPRVFFDFVRLVSTLLSALLPGFLHPLHFSLCEKT